MKKINLLFTAICLIMAHFASGQGTSCAQIQAFCSNSGVTFPANFDAANPGAGFGPQASAIDPGNDYGCLIDNPNPAWYYLEIDQPGMIEITLTNSGNEDIDFILWGPFADLTTAVGSCGSLTSPSSVCPGLLSEGPCPNGVPCDIFTSCYGGNAIGCSFDPQATEVVTLPNGQTGEVYILLITNYSNLPTNISANQTGGAGSTNCAIVAAPTSPCPCLSGATCDGLALPDQPSAVAALDAAGLNQNAPGCFDLTAQMIPAGDGTTYEFCYQYTHTSAEAFFAFSGTAYFTGPNSAGCIANPNTITTIDAYQSGACGTSLPLVNVTSDGWGVYNATMGATYELCFEISGDQISCATEDITAVCTYAHPYTITCPLFGGDIVAPTNISVCFEDIPITLSVTNEITSAQYPDIVWGVWVFDDPNNVLGVTPSFTLPADQDPLNGSDPNWWGILGDGMGGFLSGTSITSNFFVPGATIYLAPLVIDIDPVLGGIYDPNCTGLAPGYTLYMNPPLTFSGAVTNCDATIDLLGGFPSINAGADYSWSVTTPSGLVTGTGTPINFTATEDGTHTFSIVNDGLGANTCDLPDFFSFDFYACACAADAGTFSTPTGTTICFGDDFTMLTNGDYGGSNEDGGALDQIPNGDGDLFNGVIYGIYTNPPTNENPILDPNLVNIFNPIPLVPGGPDLPAIVTNSPTILATLGMSTNTTYYFTSIYSFDNDGEVGVGLPIVAVDTESDGFFECSDVNLGGAVSVVFLDEITAPFTQTCNAAGSVDITFTISGGLPALTMGEQFTVAGDGPGGMVNNNGTYSISGHPYNSTFTIVVSDGNSCSTTFSGTSFAAPTASASSSNVTCFGGGNGTANAVAVGGVLPYTYLWSPGGQVTSSITGQSAGNYIVTVTDGNGCQATSSTMIGEPAAIVVSVMMNSQTSCNGFSDGSATASASNGTPGYSFEWDNGETTAIATALTGGMHNVTVTDANSCTATSSVNITEPPALGGTTTLDSPVLCFGESTGIATVTGSGGTPGYTYIWDNGETIASVSNLIGGLHIVTVTDAAGCSATTSIDVLELLELNVVAQENTPVSCNGESNGLAISITTGGTLPYSYLWSTGSTATNPNNLPVGVHTISVTDLNGCTANTSVTITGPPAITATTTLVNNVSCNGGANGSATAAGSGGFPGFTYEWDNGEMTPTATNLNATIHFVTVTDSNNCTQTASISISEPPALLVALSINNQISCNGLSDGSVTASVSGGTPGYVFAWDNGIATPTATNLGAGPHSITVTDSNNCTATASVTITEPVVLTATTTLDLPVQCFGESTGVATVTAGGGTPGYTYLWDNGGTDATVSNLPGGIHNVTVTDTGNCTITAMVDVLELLELTALAAEDTPVSCNGESDGVAISIITGGTLPYTFNWSTGSTATNPNDLPVGMHTLSVTDLNGCTASTSVTITGPPLLTLSAVVDANVACNGESNGGATATGGGGTPGYTYEWDNGEMTAIATNLNAGIHIVTVTDVSSCTETVSVTITEPPAFTVSISIDNEVSCNGFLDGSATATISGGAPGYVFAWDNGVATATATNLGAGPHSITVTDSNNCTATASVTITEPVVLTATTTLDLPVQCFGESTGVATVTAGGGTPGYTYLWDNGGTDATVSNLPGGIHNVTVTDTGNCTITAMVNVLELLELNIVAAEDTPVSCNGESDGIAISNITGGTLPYVFNWSTGSTATNPTDLPVGMHTVSVTDLNGCTASTSVTITGPPPLTIVAVVDANVACNGESNGGATATGGGGTPGYTFEWDNGEMTAVATNLNVGIHVVTITDVSSCTETASVTITEPPLLSLSISVDNQVSCNGGSDGEATAAVTGGAPGYTYQWGASAGSQISATATNLSVGTHDVTVTDTNGCTATGNVMITEPTALGLSIAIDSNVSCNAGTDGAATATASGGTPDVSGYIYQWSASTGGQITATASNLSAGIHTLTVSDSNGCMITGSVTITEPTALALSVSVDSNVSCNGDSDGEATAAPSGGTPAYSYEWSPSAGGQMTATASGLPAGMHNVTITDLNGCTITGSVSITEPNLLSATTAVGTNVSCNAGTDGSATVTASGGTPLPGPVYNYLWDANAGGQITATATGLPAGTFVVTVTDSNNCSATSNVTITQPLLLEMLINVDANVACNGESNGAATASVNGGTPPYAFIWSPSAGNQMTISVTNLPAGTHSLTLTDSNGCTISSSVMITEPATLGLTVSTGNDVSCNGGSDGSAIGAPFGGTPNPMGMYNYQWGVSTGSQVTSTATGLTAGVHDLTVTDENGCTTTGTITINEPLALALNVNADLNVSCNGGSDGSATAAPSDGTPAYTYIWGANSSGQTTQTATGLSAGSHTVTVTDTNNCMITGSVTITEPTMLTATTAVGSNVSCFGGSDGSATGNGSGGTPLAGGLYNYLWDANAGSQATQTATGLIAGTYIVTVSDANNCTATASVMITEPTQLVATTAIVTGISCTGDSDGSATVTASDGTPGYMYQWSASAGLQITATATGLAAGTHEVTVTDANGCTVTSDILFVDPSVLTVSLAVNNSVSCNGGSDGNVTANAVGGTGVYTYQWSASAGNQITQTVTNLIEGTHTITVTDANNCTATTSVLLNAPSALGLIINVINNVSCNGGSDGTATAIPSGGVGPYTYMWSASTGNQMTAIASGLPVGTHDLTVTDANGCTITGSTTLTEPGPLTLTVTLDNDVSCNNGNDGSATANPGGGAPFPGGTYGYQWDLAAGNQVTQTATGLPDGIFSVTVTDSNNCTIVGSVTVNEPTALGLVITIDSNVSCNGGSDGTAITSMTGGTPGYTYQWSASANNQITPTAANLMAGTHFLTVTDALGCTITGSATITQPSSLALTTVMDNPVSCNGGTDGTATANPVGGTPAYLYFWSASTGSQMTQTATGLSAGLHTVTVEDFNKCIEIATVTVTEPPVLSLTITTGSDVSCFGFSDGSATAVATGGAAGFVYQWSASTGNQITQVANNLPAGIHSITVTDANNCVTTSSVTITEPTLLTLGVTVVNDVSCNGGADGSIVAGANGGTPFPGNVYTYQWSANTGNQVTQTAVGLPIGSYTVTVTDANGCTETGAAQILEPTALTFSGVVDDDVSCFGEADGQATVTAGGGTPFPGNAYLYQWSASAGNQITPTAINLAAGAYTVSVTDANGCTETLSITITQPPILTVSLVNVNGVSCFGDSDGSATANPAGGTAPYTYLWSESGEVTQTANNLPFGFHSVTVTDANNCTVVETFTTSEPSELQVVSVVGTDPLCNNEFTGSATVNFQGGTAPFNYVWNTGQVTQTANILPAGSYTVTVFDINGCSASGAVTLLNPAAITTMITTTPTSCSGASTCDGTASAVSSGGVGTYTYVWDNGFVGPNAEFLCAGPHQVTITDDNGCSEVENLFIDAAPALLPGVINSTPVSCNGGNDGAASVSPSGGTPVYTYTWLDAAGGTIATDSGPSSTITDLSAGVYTVIIEDANGCALTPIPITVNEPPVPLSATAMGTSAGCFEGMDGSATVLPDGGTPSYQFIWDGNANGQTTQTAFNLEMGTYFVTVIDNNGCETVTSATVGEPTDIIATTVTDSTTCFGEENGSLAIPTVSGGLPPYMYSLDGLNYTLDTVFTGLAAGLYDVYVQDANGCIFLTSDYVAEPIEIVINILASAADNTIIIGDSTLLTTQINLDPADSTLTYIWTPPTDLSCTDCPNPYASPLSTTTYTVEIIDSTGCSAMDDITITVLKERDLFVPNAFTPNGDNINDVFYPYGGPSVTNIKFFHVYDRWGELVWKAEDFLPDNPTFGWDGTFKNKRMNGGVFVYYLEVEFADGVVEEYKGDITLVR